MATKIDIEFNKNEDGMKLAVSAMNKKLAIIEKGGGDKAIAKQKEKGKMTPQSKNQLLSQLSSHQKIQENPKQRGMKT